MVAFCGIFLSSDYFHHDMFSNFVEGSMIDPYMHVTICPRNTINLLGQATSHAILVNT